MKEIIKKKARNGFSELILEQENKKYLMMYNKKKKICVIDSDMVISSDIPKILDILLKNVPAETTLWVCVDIKRDNFLKDLRIFIGNGFENPYVTVLSPLYNDITPSVALSKVNKSNENNDERITLNKVLHVLEQYKKDKGVCFLHAKISGEAIKFLKETCFSGFKKDKKGNNVQKELTGELYVKNVVVENGKFVYIIDINKNSVSSGENESVDVHPHRFNFHSHPHEAYIRHSVEKAWPSVTDYLGYLKLGENTIFHCVATIEGLYIMSFSPYWAQQLKKVSKKFVDKNFEIDHKEDYTPESYVKMINEKLYRGHPIYHLEFFKWNKAGQTFHVFFPQIGSSCLVSQKVVNSYKKVHF